MTEKPAWAAQKAEYDSYEDGEGPWHIAFCNDGWVAEWKEFMAWAAQNLGQGFSTACCDGDFVDPVTRGYFAGWRAGKGYSK